MIISKKPNELTKLLTKNTVSSNAKLLPGGKSRSTFEDVCQTVETIKKHKLNSVAVVTPSYHMPRALFLLYIYIKSNNLSVRSQGWPVQKPPITTGRIRYVNEIIKC